MGRATVKMELITKEKTQKTTYQNRKNGLIKKTKELSILCDVDTAIIIYPPDSSNHPEVWPENPDQIKKTIASYKQKKNENGKRVMHDDVKDYFQSRKRMIEDKLVKAREKNMETMRPTWFEDLNGLSVQQLRQFENGLEGKKRILKARLEELKKTKCVYDENQNNLQLPNHYVNLDQVQPLNPNLMGHDLEWFDHEPNKSEQPSNHSMGSYPRLDQVHDFEDDDLINHDVAWIDGAMQMPFKLETNQPSANNNVGSDPSVFHVQPFDGDDLISLDLRWFDDAEIPFEFELKNNQPSADHNVGSTVDEVISFSHDSMSHDLGWLVDAPTTYFTPQKPEMATSFDYSGSKDDVVYHNSIQPVEQSKCGFKNNQPTIHNAGSYPSVDQVQASNHGMISRIIEGLVDAPNAHNPFELIKNNQPANHNIGCLECVPNNSFAPEKPAETGIGFNYPGLEDDVVYDNSKQYCPMAEELPLQEDSHVNGCYLST